jgi:hypothetical protein
LAFGFWPVDSLKLFGFGLVSVLVWLTADCLLLTADCFFG